MDLMCYSEVMLKQKTSVITNGPFEIGYDLQHEIGYDLQQFIICKGIYWSHDVMYFQLSEYGVISTFSRA